MITEPPPTTLMPHVGPPKWMLVAGSFAAECIAVRKSDGLSAHVSIKGNGDPAFTGTAKMIGELVIALATLGSFQGKVGYLSPAHVIDTAELERRWTAVDTGAWVNITHMKKNENVMKIKRYPAMQT